MRHLAFAVGLAALAYTGVASAVTITDLVASPRSYDGQTVTVSGTVEISYAVGTESGYNLRDGAARATVVSRTGPPAAGEHLTITAVVHFIDGGADPESIHFPPLLVETSRAPGP
jgi:hypothetical protein